MKQKYSELLSKLNNPSPEDYRSQLVIFLGIVKKLFSGMNASFLEFIQNSDDAGSKKIRFTMTSEYLEIINDGDPFLEKDIIAISKIGISSKKNEDSIGRFGIGFKSVFMISERVEIVSGDDAYFAYIKSAPENNEGKLPWQLNPIFRDSAYFQLPEGEGFTTGFRIYWNKTSSKYRSDYREFLKSKAINSRLLLFLRSLNCVEIFFSEEEFIKFKKEEISTESMLKYKVTKVTEIQEESDNYVVFQNKECLIPDDVRYDNKTCSRIHIAHDQNFQKTQIQLAIYLDDNLKPARIEAGGGLHMGVYSFLPLIDFNQARLNFIIHADFITNPSRTNIEECKWNENLLSELKNLSVKTLESWKTLDDWKYMIPEIFQSESMSGGRYLWEHLIEPLTTYIKNREFFLTDDGNWRTNQDLVKIENQYQKYLTTTERKRVISDQYSERILTLNNIKKLKFDFSPQNYINNESWAFVEKKAKEIDMDFFPELFKRELLEKEGVKELKFVLNDSMKIERIANIDNVYIDDRKEKISHAVDDHIFIHPSLAKSPEIRKKLIDQGISVFTDHDERNLIRENQEMMKMDNLDKDWGDLGKEERIKWTIKIFKKVLSEGTYHWKWRLNYLTFLTKDGKWASVNEIIISAEYNPHDQQIEKIFNSELKGLVLEEEFLSKLKFLHPDYINCLEDLTIEQFIKVMADLAEKPDLRVFTETIAIQIALQYEKRNKRNPVKLSKDQEDQIHYDIKSDNRRIEVKGNNNSLNDITLSKNQFQMCLRFPKEYYLYLVVDPLTSPVLHVIPGEKLVELSEFRPILYKVQDLQKNSSVKYRYPI